jgi:hypothetical protein
MFQRCRCVSGVIDKEAGSGRSSITIRIETSMSSAKIAIGVSDFLAEFELALECHCVDPSTTI